MRAAVPQVQIRCYGPERLAGPRRSLEPTLAAMRRVGMRGRLLLPEVIHDAHRDAVVSLTGRLIEELGVFPIDVDHADRPAFFEPHIDAATGHPGISMIPVAVGVITARGGNV